jgi:DNA-binding beta-propeller fold protein YncE
MLTFTNIRMRRQQCDAASPQELQMNLRLYCLLAPCLIGSSMALAQQPLALVQSIEMPEVPAGPYADHMALDLKGQRLFVTPQANKAVDVLDLQTGKVLHTIPGFGNPHAVLYREDRNRLFVTDGGIGALRIFDATSYRELKSIKLELNADGIGYDAETGYLYVSNGGDEAGKEYSLISIIDTAREEKIGDIRVEAPGLEAMVVDHSRGRLYINLPESSSIAVIDLNKRTVIATWPLKKGKMNMAFAQDAKRHLLYVGCRDTDVRGSIVVVDTEAGTELERLPIGGWVDSIFCDPAKNRIYASAGVGEVYTYERQSNGHYKMLDPTDTAVMAKTSLFSAELDRLFVAVPHLGGRTAKVLVFKPE